MILTVPAYKLPSKSNGLGGVVRASEVSVAKLCQFKRQQGVSSTHI